MEQIFAPNSLMVPSHDNPAYSVQELTVGPNQLKAFIVDGVVKSSDLAPQFTYFSGLPYYFVDTNGLPGKNIPHLTHYFDHEKELAKNGYVARLANTTMRFFSENQLDHKGLWRIHTEFGLYGDFHMKHNHGLDWTALTFVNDEWQPDWGGEFLLYEEQMTFLTPEGVIAIPPKPGRMVIFDGRLMHRAGVPSRLCYAPRITLVMHFHR